MRLSDTLIGLGFVGAGGAIFATTLSFPRQPDGAPGPALFPQVLAALMVLFGGSLVVSSVAALRAGRAAETPPALPVGRRGVVNALLVFAAIIVFMAAAPALGFLLTTAVLLGGLMWWLGAPRLRAGLAAVGLTLFVYLIFGKLLRVPLPLGLVWF
ncbi:MAG TPA: tripartite tricarboxylate transporter TctB family protein [Methylomirabilota bacterium]|nr:tripartite tricarboxylate transporter TctB family protein [Methylomirabilota bacterium]